MSGWHPLDGFEDLYLYSLVSCVVVLRRVLFNRMSLDQRLVPQTPSTLQLVFSDGTHPPFESFHVWHVSRTCVASQSHMRDVRMTNDAAHSRMWHVYLGQMHSYVRHDPFKCGVWFVYMCEYVLGCVQNQKDPRSKSINGTMYTHINGHIHICIDVYQIKDPSRSTARSRLGFFRNGHSDLFI